MTADPAQRRRRKIARWLRIAVTCILALATVAVSVWAYRYYEYTPWTRDGRVRVYVVYSAPEVSGLVVDVPVADNQFVHKGDVLYRIDPRDYQVAVSQAQAAVDSAIQALALQKADAQRREIVTNGAISQEEKETFDINVRVDEASLESAQAQLRKANIDLGRCEIHSTVNGWITNLTVRAGNYATAGQQQLSVVDADSFYIYAYFEETQLRNIRMKATARAILMGYPNSPVLAHVDSVGRGIADSDTMPDNTGLPQVNPIFTWVRLAQRIPVRLEIDRVPQGVTLSAGETCTVYVDTK
jgi:multidrug resistance efflux pump